MGVIDTTAFFCLKRGNIIIIHLVFGFVFFSGGGGGGGRKACVRAYCFELFTQLYF